MYKILTIAAREYRAMVATKTFLVSLVMMPVLMLGSLAAIELLKNSGKIEERKIVVHDASGQFYDHLLAEAEKSNAAVRAREAERTAGPKTPAQVTSTASAPADDNEDDDQLPQASRGEILNLELELSSGQDVTDDVRADVSKRIADGELYAFVEIPAPAEAGEAGPPEILFYSQDSSLADARGWLAGQIGALVRNRRLHQADIDPAKVDSASQPVPVRGMGLLTRNSDGSITPAREKSPMIDIFLPFGAMMFMFLVIFMSSQPMLESVLEEKSQRIAEVLLGSASTFQLMLGKLLGTVAGSLTVFCIYIAGALVVAQRVPWLESLPRELLPWFIGFQILGVLFYAAIFMAVGACVSQLKEAQSMLMPVWMMMMAPMFVWLLILRGPNGSLARWLSLFPPATPTTMVMRLATGVRIPAWELVTGLVGLIIATLLVVFFAGRVFRAGILWQGKTPRFSEIIRWAISG
jgi:ABC-2 type transport system permease protein